MKAMEYQGNDTEGVAITCQKHPKALAGSRNENICKTEAA